MELNHLTNILLLLKPRNVNEIVNLLSHCIVRLTLFRPSYSMVSLPWALAFHNHLAVHFHLLNPSDPVGNAPD